MEKATIITRKRILFINLFAGISSISLFVLGGENLMLINVVTLLLFLIGNILIFKMDTFLALCYTSICSLISFIANFLCAISNVFIYSNHYMEANALTLVITAFLAYKIVRSHDLKDSFYKAKNTFCELYGTYLILFILISSFNFSAMYSLRTAFISLIIQLCIILLLTKNLIAKVHENETLLKFQTLNLEYQKLKEVVDNLRVFKHDYGNTLCSIGGYIALNDMDGLKNFYNKLTTDFNNTTNMQKINTFTINEPSIYNLLASKHNLILQNNLKFDFYSAISYKDLNICPYDFSKLLGIFLDNAIDAANLSDEKEISLVCQKNKNKDYQITIKNSYTNKDVDVEKIFEKGYSSKNIKSGLRTLGSFKNC